MQFRVNTSPVAGPEQTVSGTSRRQRARLDRELRTSVALRVDDGSTADVFEVEDEQGNRREPIEECVIDVHADQLGSVTQALGERGAHMQTMRTDAGGGVLTAPWLQYASRSDTILG